MLDNQQSKVTPSVETKSSEEHIYGIYNRYLKTGNVTLIEIIILLVAFGSLALSWFNHLKLLKTPLSNAITYLTNNHLHEVREIENILSEMLAVAQCHRIAVGLFHNGKSVGKHHFNKMSVFYEVVAPGITPLKDELQNISLSKIYDDIESSSEQSFIKVSAEDKSLKTRCVMHLDSIGVKELLSRLLVASNKGIYGIIQLHWVENTTENILENPAIVAQLNKLFNRLVSLIEENQ
ncbi:hypothetical protein [Cuspidothrix issatschenkoi]|uniref:Uncharacterized protein n=1 Tax=Cuspidothrix issatschenkoi CHARLIE-1 TaxID=2052836 RepID=A0A2S6CQD5_9CYAN|nr:hypothetical protein [Cuspidothrix issatschenkoi]PPJ61963.1 hypothetical protein CUN59_18080 [Cuspidothrix issatschenkoi CHARLIE-1]